MFDELSKIQKLYRQHPQSPLFARLADLYLRRGKVVAALELCREGCRRFPHYPTGYLILGKCYEAQGQLEEARAALDQALRLDPENPAGFAFLSRVYQGLGIPTLALKSMEQAAVLEPLSPTLAEEVDRLKYAVRVESAAGVQERGVPDIPPEPVARPVESEAEREEEVFAAPAGSAAAQAGPAALEPFAALGQAPQVEPVVPAEPEESIFAAAEGLPLEESIEALFRRGEEAGKSLLPARKESAPARRPPPEKPLPPPGQQEDREDLGALGAEVLADDSLLGEHRIQAEEAPAPEEGLFSPAEVGEEAIAASPPEEEETSLFEPEMPAGPSPQEEETSLFAPEEAAPEPDPEPLAGELLVPEEPPAPAQTRESAGRREPKGPAEAGPAAATGRQAGLPRRQDDGELIRLFQEIESQQQQELAVRRQGAPQTPPAEDSEQESRIATVTLAQIYASQGFVERAVETYRQILAQDPENETIRRRIEELQQGRKTS